MWHFKLKCEQQGFVSHANGCAGNNRCIVGWTGTVGCLTCGEIKGEALGCESTLVKCSSLGILKSTEKYILLYSTLRSRLLINSVKQCFKLEREWCVQSSKVYLWANTFKINWKILVPFMFV